MDSDSYNLISKNGQQKIEKVVVSTSHSWEKEEMVFF
jgi:hypothetical protein